MDSIEILTVVAAILALLVAIIGHEIMHGYVALKYGDTTAKDAGRLSINPLVHIDPIGTILVPVVMYFVPMLFGADNGILFGWAKPVPINTNTVINRGGYNAAIHVSLAGIIYNFTLAVIFAIILTNMSQPTTDDSLLYVFAFLLVMKLVLVNVVLGVFNLLPIPQFDGAHTLMYLSLKMGFKEFALWMQKMEPYGMIIVVILLITPLSQYILFAPVQFVLEMLLS